VFHYSWLVVLGSLPHPEVALGRSSRMAMPGSSQATLAARDPGDVLRAAGEKLSAAAG